MALLDALILLGEPLRVSFAVDQHGLGCLRPRSQFGAGFTKPARKLGRACLITSYSSKLRRSHRALPAVAIGGIHRHFPEELKEKY